MALVLMNSAFLGFFCGGGVGFFLNKQSPKGKGCDPDSGYSVGF